MEELWKTMEELWKTFFQCLDKLWKNGRNMEELWKTTMEESLPLVWIKGKFHTISQNGRTLEGNGRFMEDYGRDSSIIVHSIIGRNMEDIGRLMEDNHPMTSIVLPYRKIP